MNSLKCHIVKDLLPLYIDGACSKQTAEDVAAHLQNCASCRKLCEDMSSRLPVEIAVPEMEEKKLFRHVQQNLLAITGALLVTILCLLLNFSRAWEGGPAGIGNAAVTFAYILFWSLFTFYARKYVPLVRFSLIVSSVTLVSSLTGLTGVLSGKGGFITGILAVPAGVPFCGLRYFTDWKGLYGTAFLLSLVWIAFSGAAQYRIYTGMANPHEEGKNMLRTKLFLTGCFLLSLLPMLLNQYGGARGVQEIAGLVNLINPIGILSVCCFSCGVWGNFRKKLPGRIMGYAGTSGIVLSELYEFLTWHIPTITGEFSLIKSFQLAFPEFYIGLAVSIGMTVLYAVIDRKTNKV